MESSFTVHCVHKLKLGKIIYMIIIMSKLSKYVNIQQKSSNNSRMMLMIC